MLPKFSFTAIALIPLAITHAADPTIQTTSHQSVQANSVSIESITFSQEPARIGDRIAQLVNTSLDLESTIFQADQLANQSSSKMRRQQQRFIEVTKVDEGRVREAHVTFPISKLQTPESENPEQEVTQPVEGKSYFVTRDGNRLLVRDTEGSIPPLEEFEIVVGSLQTFGLPSPLAKFLLGRTLQLGDQLQVPPQIAAEMLGFDAHFGRVQNFEFLLQEFRMIDEQPCAIFQATIEAVGQPADPVKMKVEGQVIIQTNTCRTVSAELAGPISLSVTEQTQEGKFDYSALGKMRVAINSQYGHAKK